ncbi:MAG: hypothetical protein J7494_14160 [Sphingobium sp.]|nr:hypothetical protein [Sphingobium sp.]
MALSDAWIETALKVTGHFEDSDSPLSAVTGDFDQMGVSLGVLQWNIGSGSLQPMIAPLGQDAVVQLMPTFGRDLWRACTSPIKEGLAICRRWQNGATIKPNVKAELRTFTGSALFVRQQVARATKVAQQAYAAAEQYAAADPSIPSATKAVFCWFFDVYTQNGGLKGLDYDDVRNFIDVHGADKVDDTICDWLAGQPLGGVGAKDATANAQLWRDHIAPENLSLFVLSFLRSQLSRVEYRADVLNRKATIANRVGWVHREKHDLMQLLS